MLVKTQMNLKRKISMVIFLFFLVLRCYTQSMNIITTSNKSIEVRICTKEETKDIKEKYLAVQIDSLYKAGSSRSYKLRDGSVLVEFYDEQSALINDENDYAHLKYVRFIKNSIWNLKKDISYRIDIPFQVGREFSSRKSTKKLSIFKSDIPGVYDFSVYQLETGQVLLLEEDGSSESAIIYRDIKSLASQNTFVEEILYAFDDDEYYMKELANGNRLLDYDPNEHLVYPSYLPEILTNHCLSLKESNIYVSSFRGNLYHSNNGYWVTIDEVNQQNGAGSKMPILTLRIYETIADVREAQTEYRSSTRQSPHYEHFYQQISDRYGPMFPSKVDSLIRVIPQILNIDKDKFSISSQGVDLIDESLQWNYDKPGFFDAWFPSVLAFYGEHYIKKKGDGKWKALFDSQSNVWIPQVILRNNISAFDPIDFYKNVYEWRTNPLGSQEILNGLE